jgi:hypothetical protein
MMEAVLRRGGGLRLNDRVLWHAAFWTFHTVNELLIALVERRSVTYVLGSVLETYGVLAVPAYLNLFVLAPRLLTKRRWVLYFISLVSVAFIAAYLFVSAERGTFGSDDRMLRQTLRWTFTCLLYTGMIYALDAAVKHGRAARFAAEEKRENAERRLEHLRGQLNPHFVFNTLNSLYALAVERSPRLPDVILRHAGLLRHSLDQSHHDRVSLLSEIEFLTSYIELERLRLDGEVDVQFDVDGILRDQQVPPMLFAPLIENCFKHLAPDATGVSRVRGELRLSDDSVLLCLCNSCNAAVVANPAESRGIGLANIRERLALIYPGRHRFDVRSGPAEFSVELRLQL